MIRLLARIVCSVRGHAWALWERRTLGVFVTYRCWRCDRCGEERS